MLQHTTETVVAAIVAIAAVTTMLSSFTVCLLVLVLSLLLPVGFVDMTLLVLLVYVYCWYDIVSAVLCVTVSMLLSLLLVCVTLGMILLVLLVFMLLFV